MSLGWPDPIAYPHHSRGQAPSRGGRRGLLYLGGIAGAVVVAAALVGGTFVVVSKANTRHSCSGPVASVTVAVATDVASALESVAQDWTATAPSVNGRCVTASVVAEDSSHVAATVGRGWDTTRDGQQPQVWIPESTLWLNVAKARPDAAAMLSAKPVSIASSPVVLALRRPLAQALGWPRAALVWNEVLGAFARPDLWAKAGHPDWASLKVGLTNVATSTSGLASVLLLLDQDAKGTVSDAQFEASLGLQQVVGAFANNDSEFYAAQDPAAPPGPDSVVAAFPTLERDLVANENGPQPGALVPIYPGPNPIVADFPFAVMNAPSVDATVRDAAHQFQQYLLTSKVQDKLATYGLRTPDQKIRDAAALPAEGGFPAQLPPPRATPAPAALSSVVAQWSSLLLPTNVLALLDTSGSMSTPVPGTKLTRLQLLQQTAATGFGLMTPQTNLGLWTFAEPPGSTSEYREVVPFGPITANVGAVTRKQALLSAVGGLRANGSTPLYDAVYAAFHAALKFSQPNSNNAIMVITDGANELNGGLTLAALITRLTKEQRTDKPVQIVCIAMGPQADVAALQKISGAANGRTFVARNPAQAVQTLVLAFAGRLR
ncbi:MAG: substrate-binding domain-containing protein [Micromonosporaceae bacterium]|nr:substrate-binding domain-containing protein [Micromonosporaceae bacterium]